MKSLRILTTLLLLLFPAIAFCQDKSFPYSIDASFQTGVARSIDKVPLQDSKKIDKLLDSATKKSLTKESNGQKLTTAYNFFFLKTLAYSEALDLVVFCYQNASKGKSYFYVLNVYNKANILLSSKEIGRYFRSNNEEITHTAKIEGTGRITVYDEQEEKVIETLRITPEGKIVTDKNATPKTPGEPENIATETREAGKIIQVIKGSRKVMRFSMPAYNLPSATINAVVKVSAAGTGTFLGFAAGSTSNDKSYQDALIDLLRRTLFSRADGETLVTLSVMF